MRCPLCESPMSTVNPNRCINADCGNWEGPPRRRLAMLTRIRMWQPGTLLTTVLDQEVEENDAALIKAFVTDAEFRSTVRAAFDEWLHPDVDELAAALPVHSCNDASPTSVDECAACQFERELEGV